MTASAQAGFSRLLFVRSDRLGETLLNLPAIGTLRRAWPHSRVTLMVRPELVELFQDHPDVTEVAGEPSLPGPWWRRAWHLAALWRSWQVETVIISNPKKDYHLAAWLAGIPTRIGYDRKWPWCLTHRVPDRKARAERHEVEYNLELLRVVGIPAPARPFLRLPIRPEEDHRISELLRSLSVHDTDRVVAVHPWTSNPRKQWPREQCRTLLQRLSAMPGITPLLIGGQEERSRVGEVAEGQGGRVIDVVGRLSLRELAACLRHVRVLVTNDSGPMHVAAAVGTPVVALFGTEDPGSHPRRWGPWGDGHTVIHKPLERIAVDDVLAAVQPYLE